MQNLSCLTSLCEKYRPYLIDGVNILLENDYSHTKQPRDALKGHVCGRVNRILGYLLNSEGYDVRGAITKSLGDIYPCTDHEFLVVNADEEIIVDAAYYQFIDVFYLDKEQMPKKDILIAPYEKLDHKIEEFVNLRNLKLDTHPNPQILKNRYDKFRMNDEELHCYFKKIWDFKNQIYSPSNANSLAEDIIKFNTDGSSAVSELTSKLIDYLIKENLIK